MAKVYDPISCLLVDKQAISKRTNDANVDVKKLAQYLWTWAQGGGDFNVQSLVTEQFSKLGASDRQSAMLILPQAKKAAEAELKKIEAQLKKEAAALIQEGIAKHMATLKAFSM